jgi:hypothetical protein
MHGWLNLANHYGYRDSTVYPQAISMACYYAMVIALVKLQVLGKEPISNADSQTIGYPIKYYTNCYMGYPKGNPNS